MQEGHLFYPLCGLKKKKKAKCLMVLILGLIYFSFRLPDAPGGALTAEGDLLSGAPAPPLPSPLPPHMLANGLGWKLSPCPSGGHTVGPLLSGLAEPPLLIPVLLKQHLWWFWLTSCHIPAMRTFPTLSLPTLYQPSQSPRVYLNCGLQGPRLSILGWVISLGSPDITPWTPRRRERTRPHSDFLFPKMEKPPRPLKNSPSMRRWACASPQWGH